MNVYPNGYLSKWISTPMNIYQNVYLTKCISTQIDIYPNGYLSKCIYTTKIFIKYMDKNGIKITRLSRYYYHQIDQQSSTTSIYGGLKFVVQYLSVCLHLANVSVLLLNRYSFSPFKMDIFFS